MSLILPAKVSSLSRLSRALSSAKYADARYFILVDENTYAHCLAPLVSHVEPLQEAEFLEVPAGEECKDIAIASQLWESLIESQADRNAVIVNLGGGCISDLGGFVAAGFKRGIRYINVPTTLIGMADAAIGGKTALNLSGSKNQVGFIQQPEITCIEPSFLDTLPDSELFNGVFEMLKTFLVGDAAQYRALSDMLLSGTLEIKPEMLASCAEIKAAVVRQDPEDRSLRHILNFGHTFGHAIESYSRCEGQQPLGHGMAVGIGMACAMYLSVQKLGLSQDILDRYRQAASKLLAMPRYSLADTERLLGFMRQDKKNAEGQIRCVLLQDLCAPVIDLPIDENEIRAAFMRL